MSTERRIVCQCNPQHMSVQYMPVSSYIHVRQYNRSCVRIVSLFPITSQGGHHWKQVICSKSRAPFVASDRSVRSIRCTGNTTRFAPSDTSFGLRPGLKGEGSISAGVDPHLATGSEPVFLEPIPVPRPQRPQSFGIQGLGA